MYLSLGHLYELIYPYNSCYVYVCSDWNKAHVKWANFDTLVAKYQGVSSSPFV